jgi:hypothetical protein
MADLLKCGLYKMSNKASFEVTLKWWSNACFTVAIVSISDSRSSSSTPNPSSTSNIRRMALETELSLSVCFLNTYLIVIQKALPPSPIKWPHPPTYVKIQI